MPRKGENTGRVYPLIFGAGGSPRCGSLHGGREYEGARGPGRHFHYLNADAGIVAIRLQGHVKTA